MLINNRYQVVRTLGEGGFGHAYLAEDVQMPSQRLCVLKQLKPLTTKPEVYQVVQDRFQREAAILERLGEDHKQIPRLYAYFSENQRFYLVQEWIEGTTLEALVAEQGVLSEVAVKSILVALLPVLDFIHAQGIIHRDLKPDNIMLRADTQQPVLIDFGAVRETMGTVMSSYSSPRSSIVIGTPGFMPSEQAAGRPIPSSDLYSLGLTAIFLLTRQLPQSLASDPQTGEVIWRPVAGHVSSGLVEVIDRAVRSHPRDRYSSASQMLADLSALPGAIAPPSQLPAVPNQPVKIPARPPSAAASTLKTVVVAPGQAAPVQADPSTYQQDMQPTLVGSSGSQINDGPNDGPHNGPHNRTSSFSGSAGDRLKRRPLILGLLIATVGLGAIASGFLFNRPGEEPAAESARVQSAKPKKPSDQKREQAADTRDRPAENASDDMADREEVPEESPSTGTSNAQSGEQITLSSSSSSQIALYDNPSFASSSSQSGRSGDRATILRQSQGDDGATWYYVRYSSGAEGWVSSAYASSGSAAPPAPETTPEEEPAPTQPPTPEPAPTAPPAPEPAPSQAPQLEGGSPGDQVDVYSAPSSSSNSPHYGLVGDRVTVLNTAQGDDGRMWSQVQFASGARGWVSSDTVGAP